MVEGKGSTLVHLLVVTLCLVAFGFAIAAERRRSTCVFAKQLDNSMATMFSSVVDSSGRVIIDPANHNVTYCVYNSDVATGYGVGSFLFLLSSQSLLMGVTKCMCFGTALTPGSDRAWSIIYFASSWITFLVAEACTIAGATKNAYHTKYRGMIYADNLSCETLRKGVFVTGAVFVVATMILNVYFYMYFTKAAVPSPAHKANRKSSSVGMAGYA
ncbi:hypothetical protein ACFE04_016600 [Oxalis oulophora]